MSILIKINDNHKKKRISDLAGFWKMSDKEAEEFLGELKKGWKKWKIESA